MVVVDAAVLYFVVQYLGVGDEVLQPYALGTAQKKERKTKREQKMAKKHATQNKILQQSKQDDVKIKDTY